MWVDFEYQWVHRPKRFFFLLKKEEKSAISHMCPILASSIWTNLPLVCHFLGYIFSLRVSCGVQEVTKRNFHPKCLIHRYFQTSHFWWYLGYHRSQNVQIWVQSQEMWVNFKFQWTVRPKIWNSGSWNRKTPETGQIIGKYRHACPGTPMVFDEVQILNVKCWTREWF